MRRVNRDQRATHQPDPQRPQGLGARLSRACCSAISSATSLGATGTHVGCEHGVCGCCTVLIDGAAVRSCLTLAVQAEGREVTHG